MSKRVLIAVFCMAFAGRAHAADVQLGNVTLKLDPPAGECAFDPGQASDKRMIDFLNTALGNGGIDLLGMNADCGELRDWRAGSLPLLKHFAQYQIAKASRTTSFTLKEAAAACAQTREQGAKMASDSTGEANDSIHKANSKIDFQGQTFLGVLAQDPNGCYVGMFQKYKAETGAIVSQLNVFFMGSIKDRAVNFYLWGPHENDASVATMLTAVQAQVAKVKSANGL